MYMYMFYIIGMYTFVQHVYVYARCGERQRM